MPRRSPTWVRLHVESAVDRWVKRIRLSNEIQTGDARFDRLVYVTSDHPSVERTLATSPALRNATCDVLEAGYRKVEFDGTSVVIQRESGVEPTEDDLELLSHLQACSAVLEQQLPSRFRDPFLWKALLFEGFIWSLLGYSVGAFVQLVTQREDLHVAPRDILLSGSLVASAFFVALVLVIAFVMWGSSRGHRIVVESALVLLIGLPCASIQLVADTNRALDSTAPERRSAVVLGCEERERRGRKGRKTRSYHLSIAFDSAAEREAHTIRVTRPLCTAAHTADRAEIIVGRGRWSLPWYRQITVGNETWVAQL